MEVFIKVSTGNKNEIIELNRKLNKDEKSLISIFIKELSVICTLKKELELLEFDRRFDSIKRITEHKLYPCSYDGQFSIVYLGTVEDINNILLELGRVVIRVAKSRLPKDDGHDLSKLVNRSVEIEYHYEDGNYLLKDPSGVVDITGRIHEFMNENELKAISKYLEIMESNRPPKEKRKAVLSIKTGRIDRLYKKFKAAKYITILLKARYGKE